MQSLTLNTVKLKVPGKVMIAGEWNILEEKHSCLAFAINNYAECSIHKSERFSISFPNLSFFSYFEFANGKIILLVDNLNGNSNTVDNAKNFSTAFNAIETSMQYLMQHLKENNYLNKNLNKDITPFITPFSLVVDTSSFYISSHNTLISGYTPKQEYNHKQNYKLNHKQKIGLGSSSASLIGIIGSILAFHGFSFETYDHKLFLFKLSCIADISLNGISGSYYDLATSVFGGVVEYTLFDREWLKHSIKLMSITELVACNWPFLEIKQLDLSLPYFLLCYSGQESSTQHLIQKIILTAKTEPVEYARLMKKINSVVEHCVTSLQKKDI